MGDEKLRVSLIKAGEPDINGFVWPKDVLEKAIKDMNRKEYFVQHNYSKDGKVYLGNVSGFTIPGTAEIKDGYLFCKVKFVGTEMGKLGKELLDIGVGDIRGCWKGTVAGRTVNETEIIYFAIVSGDDREKR